jgi:hypothetical protein
VNHIECSAGDTPIHVGRINIQHQVLGCRLEKVSTLTEYFTQPCDYHLQRISTPDDISQDETCMHILNNLP